jgi:hypothetical protein
VGISVRKGVLHETAFITRHNAILFDDATVHSCRQNDVQYATLQSTSTLKLARPRLWGYVQCVLTQYDRQKQPTATICVNRA